MIQSMLTRDYFPASGITIGVDISIHREAMVALNEIDPPYTPSESEMLSLLLFDLGGQEQFHFIHSAFIIGAKAAVIVYDLTRAETFDNIPRWIELFQTEYPSIPIFVVGTKRDLVSEESVNSFITQWEQMRKSFAPDVNIVDHFTFSSKVHADRDEMFAQLWQLAQNWQKKVFESQLGLISSKQ
jgi:GTPase SAR1 family protein